MCAALSASSPSWEDVPPARALDGRPPSGLIDAPKTFRMIRPGKVLSMPKATLIEGRKVSMSGNREKRHLNRGGIMRESGYTMIETLVVVAVLGILLILSYPNIKNSLEVRALENQARSILGSFQQAKFQAVRDKLNYRVKFDNSLGYWTYFVEEQVNYGVWQAVHSTGKKSIPSKYVTTISLPSNIIEFTPLGMPNNYSISQHSVTLQSQALATQGKPSRRTINVFQGGSMQYVKAT